MPSPFYKTSAGVWTNVPGAESPAGPPDLQAQVDAQTVKNPAPGGWEGQGILDDAKAEAGKSDSLTQSFDRLNATFFPRAAAAKEANPTLYGQVATSQDFADLDRQLQHEEDAHQRQNSVGGSIVRHIPGGAIPLAAALATPFVGPEATVPLAIGGTAALDMLKSHYSDPDAPQSGGEYLGDLATSAAAPATAALGEYALAKAPALLSKPGVIPGALGVAHGYHRAGWSGALEEGVGGYYAGKLFGGLGALQSAAKVAGLGAEAIPAAEAAAAAEAPTEEAEAAAAHAKWRAQYRPPSTPMSGTQVPSNSPEDVIRNMGGRYADKEAGFSPDMVEKLNAIKRPGVKIPKGPGVPKAPVVPPWEASAPEFSYAGEAIDPGHPPAVGGTELSNYEGMTPSNASPYDPIRETGHGPSMQSLIDATKPGMDLAKARNLVPAPNHQMRMNRSPGSLDALLGLKRK